MTDEKEFTVRLLSHEFRVVVESPAHWSEGGMGRASLKDQIIRLNDCMPSDVRHSTLLHEVMHLISDLTSIEMTEIQVDVAAQGIFTLIKDNPELVADIGVRDAVAKPNGFKNEREDHVSIGCDMDQIDVPVMHIGKQLAKDLLAVGDEPGSPVYRLQFKGGKYPDEESNQGGMCETALARFFAKRLKKYFLEEWPTG